LENQTDGKPGGRAGYNWPPLSSAATGISCIPVGWLPDGEVTACSSTGTDNHCLIDPNIHPTCNGMKTSIIGSLAVQEFLITRPSQGDRRPSIYDRSKTPNWCNCCTGALIFLP